MKTVILYSGHLGSTAKAAHILATMIDGATVLDTALKPKINFQDYDTILFGTNVRMFMLNGRFKKYARQWRKSKSEAKVFAYVIGASCEKSNDYVKQALKVLGGNAFVVFAGGELNAEGAKGFAKKIIESVTADFLAKGQPLPQIDKSALMRISEAIV